MRVHRGETKRLIITLPPRHLKSLSTSVAFVAWGLGHDPTRRIITASYGADLAIDFSLQTRKVMEASWYKSTFPGTRLDPKRKTQSELHTTRNGFRLATFLSAEKARPETRPTFPECGPIGQHDTKTLDR